MKRIEVHFTSEVIIKNSAVDPQNCNSIRFENIGNINAVIDGAIPLYTSDVPREFNNENPYAIMSKPITVNFQTNASGKAVLITRIFKKVIE